MAATALLSEPQGEGWMGTTVICECPGCCAGISAVENAGSNAWEQAAVLHRHRPYLCIAGTRGYLAVEALDDWVLGVDFEGSSAPHVLHGFVVAHGLQMHQAL